MLFKDTDAQPDDTQACCIRFSTEQYRLLKTEFVTTKMSECNTPSDLWRYEDRATLRVSLKKSWQLSPYYEGCTEMPGTDAVISLVTHAMLTSRPNELDTFPTDRRDLFRV